jgi:hypothetical protein
MDISRARASLPRLGAALCCGALALASREARADEFQDHVDHATTLAQTEHYKEALAELEAAYGMRQSPRLLYMKAKMQQRLGDAKAALDSYERFLASEPDPDPRVRADAEGEIAKLRRLLGKGPPPAPQPVMNEPRSEQPPPEVHYEMKPSVGLIVGGSVLFGAAYMGAVVTGSVFLSSSNTNYSCSTNNPYYASNNCPGGNQQTASGTLLIPVLGPFIAALAYRDPVWSINWALVDGVAQVGGVAMIAYAATHPKKVPVIGEGFQVVPYAGPTGGGLKAVGRF